MMKTSRTLLVLAMASALPGLSAAAGFSLNEQSIKSLGTALAGKASMASDATTVYGNPAGMSRLEGTHISGNIALIDAPAKISNTGGFPNTGTNNGDMIPATVVGSNFATHQFSENLHGGFGVYAPFGLSTNYEDSFQGRFFGDKSKVKVIAVQPTVSYKLSPELSVGAGLVISKIEGVLSRSASPLAPGSYSLVEGDDISNSFNLGVHWVPRAATRFGLVYHSKTDYDLSGTTTITNLPTVVPGGNATYAGSLEIATPDSLDLSVSHQWSPTTTVHAGVILTRWGVLKELVIKNEGAPAALATAVEELDWHDSWLYSVGAEWQVQEKLTLRAGIGHDETPINGGHRSVRVPSADRDYATLGLGYRLNENLSADLAYEFIKEDKSEVNVHNASGLSYSAEYSGKAHIFGMQLNLRY
jgi:long-chain fatty acid transport protein